MKRLKLSAALVVLVVGASMLAGAPAKKPKNPARPDSAKGPATVEATVTVSHDAKADVYSITDQVQIKSPLNFGVNFAVGVFKPWGNDRRVNLWNAEASMEPIVMRHSQLLSGCPTNTKDCIDENWQVGKYDPHRAGVSWFGGFPDKLWNDADLRIYRADEKDGYYKLIHKTTVKNYRCNADRKKDLKDDARIDFATPMPDAVAPCRENDFIVLTKVVTDVPAPDDPRFEEMKNGFMKAVEGARRVIDTSTKCPEGGSTASMKLTLPGSEKPAGLSHPYLRKAAGPKDLGWLKLPKGDTLKCALWLKQDGLENGEVLVQLGSLLSKKLNVTGEWKKYDFDVPTDESLLTDRPEPLFIGSTRKGTLWVDNFVVYQASQPPFAVEQRDVEALKAWRPGTLRIWVGLHARTLECALSQKFQELNQWSTRRIEGSSGFSIPQALELCEQVGANPWLILYPGYDDEECQHLMEYLAAPADVGYGKRRAADGHAKPWTEVFGRIFLECDNEAFNSGFAPLAYPGNPREYGELAGRMFHLFKTSPYYQKDRFAMVANGWSVNIYRPKEKDGTYKMDDEKAGWCTKVALACPDADIVDVAYYYGGADGLTVLGKDDKAVYTSQLMYSARLVEPGIEACQALAGEIKQKHGHDLAFACYEGGPGYAIPGPGHTMVEPSEEVGKSLAMGVLTLDAYMYELAQGFVANNYFSYGTGYNWACFKEPNDMVPYPSWQALGLRNNYCRGDLLKVEPTNVKRVDYSEEVAEKLNWLGDQKVIRHIPARAGIPLTMCYAFRDGKTCSILALNRTYDEARPITLKLPFKPSAKVTIHMLTAPDPRTNNRFAENVKVTTETRQDFAGEYPFTLPASSACVLECAAE